MKLVILTFALTFTFSASADLKSGERVLVKTEKREVLATLVGLAPNSNDVLVQYHNKDIRQIAREDVIFEVPSLGKISKNMHVKIKGVEHVLTVAAIFPNNKIFVGAYEVGPEEVVSLPISGKCLGQICKGQYFTDRQTGSFYNWERKPIVSNQYTTIAKSDGPTVIQISDVLSDGSLVWEGYEVARPETKSPYFVGPLRSGGYKASNLVVEAD